MRLKSMTNKVSYLEDGDICVLTNDKIDFYNSQKKKINKKVFTLSDNEKSNEKGDFKDFMSKEIHEQPSTLNVCLNEYTDKLRNKVNFYNFPMDPKKIKKIVLIGCGTAYHSCLTAKYWLEEFTSIEVNRYSF